MEFLLSPLSQLRLRLIFKCWIIHVSPGEKLGMGNMKQNIFFLPIFFNACIIEEQEKFW